MSICLKTSSLLKKSLFRGIAEIAVKHYGKAAYIADATSDSPKTQARRLLLKALTKPVARPYGRESHGHLAHVLQHSHGRDARDTPAAAGYVLLEPLNAGTRLVAVATEER